MSNGPGGTAASGARALREALDWLAADQVNNELSDETIKLWDDWCAHPENRTSYKRAVELRQSVRLSPRPPLPSRKALRRDLAHELQTTANRQSTFARGRHSLFSDRSKHLWHPLGFAFVAAAFVGLAAAVVFSSYFWGATLERSYATDPGEQRELMLPDGSSITLGGGTAMSIRFSRSERSIDLDHGDGYFQVMHDSRRPFVVRAGGGTTTAIGTEFEVRRYGRYSEHVQVWVRQGAVEVAPRKEIESDYDTGGQGTPKWIPVLLGQGQVATYADNAITPPRVDKHAITAWREGHLAPLVYRGMPLTDVLEDVQSYTIRELMIDAAVADLQYTGTIIQEDVEAWIHDLPSIYPEVLVIDCRTANSRVPGCSDPRRIIVRWWLQPKQNSLQSAGP
jgi:transmembrane sensor